MYVRIFTKKANVHKVKSRSTISRTGRLDPARRNPLAADMCFEVSFSIPYPRTPHFFIVEFLYGLGRAPAIFVVEMYVVRMNLDVSKPPKLSKDSVNTFLSYSAERNIPPRKERKENNKHTQGPDAVQSSPRPLRNWEDSWHLGLAGRKDSYTLTSP